MRIQILNDISTKLMTTVNIADQKIKSQNSKDFMKTLVNQMAIAFSVPDEKFIKQGEVGTDMFFMISGDCLINVRDRCGN